MIPQTGHIVRVRSRQYLVEGVDLPPRPGDSTLVRLSCLEDDAQGEPLEVEWGRELDAPRRAVLHAKCVVVDGRWSLLTSANFTEAAQERNIEAGVLVEDRRFAERVVRQFDGLVERGDLRGLRT